MGDPDPQPIVWVLGAGFSQPLGGPLLSELFTARSEGDLRVRYRRLSLFTQEADRVRWLYRWGSSNDRVPTLDRTTNKQGELLWRNAEEFIEYLDAAAVECDGELPQHHAQHHAQRLHGALAREPDREPLLDARPLRDMAKRLIAAECSGFLEGVDGRSERWKPFRRWARALQPSDTVVTFNYDLVLELLRDAQNEDHQNEPALKPSVLKVILPAPEIEPKEFEHVCPVLKLHGSVNWQHHITNGRPNGTVTFADHFMLLDGPARFMALATPGPSKMDAALGSFKSLWDLACERIKSAAAIVFVGFRFPETDAHPREVLLEAIGESARGEARQNPLQIHVVLGPRTEHADRVKALLDFAGRISLTSCYYEAAVHPLYSQDFLAVARRELLVP